MRVGKQIGFTIVELLVVVVVLLILTAITSALYSDVQTQAKDTKVADAADKVADALKLYIADNGRFPVAGWGSTAAIGPGPECNGGFGGWFATGSYSCSLEDVLILNKYLPAGFSSTIPQGTFFPGATHNTSIMVDGHNASSRYVLVSYRMDSPSAADTAHFNAELTKCGINPAGVVGQRDGNGMTNGICVKY